MSESNASYLQCGTFARAEDDWCERCFAPSLLQAPITLLSIRGVTLWGSIKGCRHCSHWVWYRLNGSVYKVVDKGVERKPNKEDLK